MSIANISKQRSFNAQPKESFQSIDDYYLQTEEDEATNTRPKIRTKTTHIGDSEIPKLSPTMQGEFRKQSNHKNMFQKPRFIARSMDSQNQSANQGAQKEKLQAMERPISPKVAKWTGQSNYSMSQIRGDFMPSIKESDEDKSDKKHLHHIEYNANNKAIPQRTLLTMGTKNDAFSTANLINITDIQRRNQTAKSDTKSITSLKENIFAKDAKQEGIIDIKTNQLFGLGPRYDPEGNIIQYTVAGKPEWYLQAQEDQKAYRRTVESPKQRLNKKISMASFASKTSSVRIKSSIDTLSRVEKKKKTSQKIIGDQQSKEQLVRKLENFEKNIEINKRQEEKGLEKIQFFEKVIEEKQKHQLEQFEKTAQKWDKINLKISEKVLRLPDHTLLKSSVPQFRQKVEVSNILEQIKNPNEILGDKFWEATLRDKFIDYTKIKTGTEVEDGNSQNSDLVSINKNRANDKRCSSSNQADRSMYRELSYTKGTRVPILFKKEVEVIKHPKLSNPNSQQNTAHNTLQYQTLGQFFGSMNSELGKNVNSSQPRPLISQQMSRRPYSQQSMSTMSYRAKTPFNCTEFANANEFMNSIQSNAFNHTQLLNTSFIHKNNHNHSSDRMSQFFTAITADADELIVKGESKLQTEKQALLNDGNSNQYLYKTLNQDELNLIERMKNAQQKSNEQKDQQNHSTQGKTSMRAAETGSHAGAIMKQSTFGHQKKASNLSEISFNPKDNHLQNRQLGKVYDGQNNGLGSNLGSQTFNADIQSNKSLKYLKNAQENHLNSLTQSINRSAFNSPFQNN